MRQLPDLGITYIESIDSQMFVAIASDLAAEGLDLRIESRPEPGPQAAIEWLLPTAVVVFIGHSYFDGFLKEAGKDHYQLLKAALSKIGARMHGKDAPRFFWLRKGAPPAASRYSFSYSVVADLGNGVSAKLLLQSDFDADLCDEAQTAFLAFVAQLHNGSLDSASIKGLANAEPVWNKMLFAYDPATKSLEIVDPLVDRPKVEA